MIGHDADADYLNRLLCQISGAVDRVAFVGASIGRCERCKEILEASGIQYEYEELVFDTREDFHFGQAREASRELAESVAPAGAWLLWLDCDDEVFGIKNLRELIAKVPRECNGVQIKYDVGPSHDNLQKVRLHRPGSFKWINRVHEELVPIGEAKLATTPDIEVIHRPDPGKSNHDFHITLLEKEGDLNSETYIGKEYYNSCRFEQAIPYLERTSTEHPHEQERYVALIALGNCLLQTGKEIAAIEEWKQAMHLIPTRREAYFYLAEYYGRKPELKKGYGYIMAGQAQIDEGQPNQHRLIYRLTGWKLLARYEQRAGRLKEAMAAIVNITEPDEESEQMWREIEEESRRRALIERGE